MSLQIIYQCPVCQERRLSVPSPQAGDRVSCTGCAWTRDEGAGDFADGALCRCRICGCQDLWRQKDFPPGLGLLVVSVAAILSSIAWAMYRPLIATGVLMAAALIDMALYVLMGDMLVCYRCGARHRKLAIPEKHPTFDLEVRERYRQQELRNQAGAATR